MLHDNAHTPVRQQRHHLASRQNLHLMILDASVEGFLPCPRSLLGIRAPVQNGAFLDAHTQPFSRNAGRRLLKGFRRSLVADLHHELRVRCAGNVGSKRLAYVHGQLLYALE